MKAITLYEATDGTRWETPERAAAQDAVDAMVKHLQAQLPATPAHARERIAIDEAQALAVKVQLIDLCRTLWPNEPVFDNDPAEIHPFSYAGRFLSEQTSPINRIWHWFMCQNGGWLYQQPYYAIHPDRWLEEHERAGAMR